MKRNYLLLIMALATVFANAVERSEQTLKEIAANVLNTRTNGARVIGDDNSLKIMHEYKGIAFVGSEGRGFAVLAIDDAFDPVLGYASGDFDKDNINPNMLWWMECTAKAMAKGATRSMDNGIPDGLPQEIGSFITSHWNQSTPYNNLCPSYIANGSTKKYPSGCVATAMAQAMNYYKYPEHGTSTRLYRFRPGENEPEQTIKVVLDDIKFDWNNMLDNYVSNQYDDAQANAVAELMQACGASVEMTYTVSGSGAYTYLACLASRDYFAYDRALPYYSRIGVSFDEFSREIYKNLANKRPIVFNGADESRGGHAFVLDGYDAEGNVHVNWGWGSNGGDGYFNIALMDGFNQQQGFFPLCNDGTYTKKLPIACIYEGGLSVSKVDNTHLKVSTNGSRLLNIDCETYKGDVYVVAMNMETGESTAIATESIGSSIAVYYYFGQNGINKSYITIKNKIGDGKYRLFLALKGENEENFSPVRCVEGNTNSYFIEVTDGVITDVMPDDNPAWMSVSTAIRNVKADTKISSNKTYTLDGKEAPKGYRGVVVKNGKKMISNTSK